MGLSGIGAGAIGRSTWMGIGHSGERTGNGAGTLTGSNSTGVGGAKGGENRRGYRLRTVGWVTRGGGHGWGM